MRKRLFLGRFSLPLYSPTMKLSEKTAPKIYEEKHLFTYRRFPVTFVKGQGTRVWDTEGKEYIDALAGIAVNNTGHCHPKVVRAIREQAATLIHISNLYHNIPQSALAKLLTEVSGMDRVFFCNSGLEANEGALKFARKYGDKKGKKGPVVYFSGCFHGRSVATIAMGKEAFQRGFGPLPKGFLQLSYNNTDALDKIPHDAKAVFVECVQGEGGINIGEDVFIKKLHEICVKNDILLVVDDIQAGMGRTGKLFSYEHYGIEPDIITLAKGLGAGVPIGAILMKQKVADAISPGDHGSTFGGNPLACAAALASLEVILEENLVANAAETGSWLLSRLHEMAKEFDDIRDVRGLGLMIGIEFEEPCRELALKLLQNGLLVSCTAQHVIRLVPPLILTAEEADKIIAILKHVLSEKS